MVLLLLTLLVGCGLLASRFDRPADPADAAEHMVEIPKGSTARSLGPILEAAGVIDDADRFTTWVRLSGEGGCLKAGRFALRRDMAPSELVRVLCGPPLPEDVPFTVVEGWRIREIDGALAAAGLAPPGAYASLASDGSTFHPGFSLPAGSLEGYLYPDTYMVTPTRFEVRALIERQLRLFSERFATPYAEEAAHRGLHEIVIMASLLEREEPKPENRPLVAGILWKRLDNDWPLGVDATSRYSLPDWNDRRSFLKNLRDPSEPYNTRLRQGLPPGPIGNPSLSSLLAAMRPVASEYWYYLHDSAQVLRPSRNEAEHERFRRIYGVW